MKRHLAAGLLALAALPAGAAGIESTGVTPGGAAYRIAVPEGWREGDGLVLIQHGFSFAPVLDPTLGPLRDRMLADGYAVAASGYRQRAWALFTARDDNHELLEVFRAEFGNPGPLVAAGGSMGGLVSLKLAEDPRFREQMAGVLAFCPVAEGVAAWDTAFDLRLAYDAICQPADGGDLPRGDEPTPWALNLAQLPPDVENPEESDAFLVSAAGIARCTGLGIPEPLRTAGMRERLAALKVVAQTQDEEALLQQLAYAVIGLSDLVRAPDKLAGRVPFFNLATTYEEGRASLDYRQADPALPADLDARIARVERDDFARLDFHRSSSLDGSGKARVVSLHTLGDAVVPAWHQRTVHARAGERALIGIVRNDSAAHCGFTASEVDAGWRTLRDWVAGSSDRPTLATLDANCRATGDAAACRFEPYEANAAQRSARLRTTLTDVLARYPRRIGGLWTSPGLPAQGLMIEELDAPLGASPRGEQRYALYWYTWAPASDPQPGPRWIVGIGRSHEGTLYADDLLEVRGGRFGPLLDPASLRYVPWGSLAMALDDGPGVMRYAGPPGWGAGERRFEQTTVSDFGLRPGVELDPPPTTNFARTGTYYDPRHPGQGWVLNQYRAGHDVASLLVAYTHDADGAPAWLFGLDADDRDGLQFAMTRAAGGGTFEAGAAPAPPNLQPWGSVTLETSQCDVTAVSWHAVSPALGSGRSDLVRLTAPLLTYDAAGCRR